MVIKTEADSYMYVDYELTINLCTNVVLLL